MHDRKVAGGPAVSTASGEHALKGVGIETGNFASPSRGGFALFVVGDCACA